MPKCSKNFDLFFFMTNEVDMKICLANSPVQTTLLLQLFWL